MIGSLRAKYNDAYSSFSVGLEGMAYSDRSRITMLMDTGSPYTVLSLRSLYEHLTEDPKSAKEAEAIRERLTVNDISAIEPNSASGHPVRLFPCCMKDVFLGRSHLPDFYFYLADMGKNLALLGNDLTSYCIYHHERKSDINILSFDYDGYVKEFKEKNNHILYLDELFNKDSARS